MISLLPAFRYINKIALIDDDELFMVSAIEYLNAFNPLLRIQSYIDPNKVIADINNSKDVSNYISVEARNEFGEKVLEYDLEKTFNMAYNANRNDIAVLIVDYEMPNIDGLSVLKNLKNDNIFRILLTGTANEAKAVEAFNSGLINAYIKKQDKDIYEKLHQIIIDAYNNSFIKGTSELTSAVLKTEKNSLLGKKEYQKLFLDYIKEYNIIEFYLIDEIGSYYMLSNNTEYILYITEKTKNIALGEYLEEKNTYGDTKKEYNYFIDSLKNGKQLIYDQLIYKDSINQDNYNIYKKQSNKLIINNKEYFYFFAENRIKGSEEKIFRKFSY
jgi:CheY-like chemotaxis protein